MAAPKQAIATVRQSALAVFCILTFSLLTTLNRATAQRTFSMGIPNFPFSDEEVEIYNHTLSPGSAMGVVNHMWSTACGGRSIDWASEGGIALYRLYVDGESTASVQMTMREAVGLGPFDPAAGSSAGLSLKEPWGNDLFGKLSDMDGFFFKIKIPFYASVRLTAQLPNGTAGFNVYTIIRGVESDASGSPPLMLPGFGALPLGSRLLQHRNEALLVPNLAFIPILNLTQGSGLVFAHSVAVSGNPGFLYLEGCFHLISPVAGAFDNATGVAAGFPGAVLSTGTEDFYSSSFYFHAGLFDLHDTGVTHMCGVANTVAPRCVGTAANNGSEWAAYRVHDTDPLLFSGGVQLLMRNGDKEDPTPYGTGKCYNLDMTPDGMSPGASIVQTTAWAYIFPT